MRTGMALLTRRQACRRLSVSITQLRRLEPAYLHPQKVNGRVFYDEADVEKAVAGYRRTHFRRPPKPRFSPAERLERARIARIVFETLGAGGDWSRCVVASNGDLEWVREAYLAFHEDPIDQAMAEREAKNTDKLVEARQLDRLRVDRDRIRKERLRLKEELVKNDRIRAERGEPRDAKLLRLYLSGEPKLPDAEPTPEPEK